MANNKPMQVLLIEDNELEVNNFMNFVKEREDIRIVKTTNSSYEGLNYTKTYMPEAIILDLELHSGEGSGINFLEEMQKINLDFKPLIVVTTNISSDIIYNKVRLLGADFIFYKKQNDYSPDIVINLIASLRETLYANKASLNKTTTENPLDHEERIKEKINSELDLIGVSSHLKGRKYLFDAILYLLQNDGDDSVFNYLANTYKVGNSSISRAMQTAINYAWRISPIEDLMAHYKARINYETGVPTPTELVYYYAEKISKFM